MWENKQELEMQWQGFNIRLTYRPDFSSAVRKVQGYALAHLELRCANRLPITETGYRSIFLPDSEVQEAGGAVALVTLLLNTAAEAEEWRNYLKESRQLRLF